VAKCQVSIEESSQFASALLLCAKAGGWGVGVTGDDAEESAYVAMTRKLIEAFPKAGERFEVEPDASSGSYFLAGGKLLESLEHLNPVTVTHWPTSGWQVDAAFPRFLPLPVAISRRTDLGDSIMTAIVLAPFAASAVRFTDLGRLRLQECERVVALRTELTRCGARVVEEGDTLTVYPSRLHGAEIETYNDHRMAMCFAILGLKVPGIKLNNASCVKKTFPNYFQKLAAPPPHGLGVTILDGKTGRALSGGRLLAEGA
jgi:3-phosphoshikimate 1-carboxyvinyltransferase